MIETHTDIGSRLSDARKQRGVTLADIARVTKIPVPTLEAMERNDFVRLPGGIFRRAHIRAFAAAVGIGGEQLVHDYLEAFEPAPSIEVVRQLEAEHRLRASRRRVALLIAAALAIGGWWLAARASNGIGAASEQPHQTLDAGDQERSDDVAPPSGPMSRHAPANEGRRLRL